MQDAEGSGKAIFPHPLTSRMIPNSDSPGVVLETSRLLLREMGEEDAAFILGLLNEASFVRFVGDRGLRTVEDSSAYIRNGPRASYSRHGFGSYLVVLRESGIPIGICGLVRRDWLDDPDLGFSLLPAYWSQGYAMEASTAVLERSRAQGIHRILAITNPDNRASILLLERLGFAYSKLITNPEGEQLNLFIRRRS